MDGERIYSIIFIYNYKKTAEKGPTEMLSKEQRVGFAVESIPFYNKIVKNVTIVSCVTPVLLDIEKSGQMPLVD